MMMQQRPTMHDNPKGAIVVCVLGGNQQIYNWTSFEKRKIMCDSGKLANYPGLMKS